jgi:hypothetical protein
MVASFSAAEITRGGTDVTPNRPRDNGRNSAPTSPPNAGSRLKSAARFVAVTIVAVAVLVAGEIYLFTSRGLTFFEALGRVTQPTLSDSVSE